MPPPTGAQLLPGGLNPHQGAAINCRTTPPNSAQENSGGSVLMVGLGRMRSIKKLTRSTGTTSCSSIANASFTHSSPVKSFSFMNASWERAHSALSWSFFHSVRSPSKSRMKRGTPRAYQSSRGTDSEDCGTRTPSLDSEDPGACSST
jgi:hypothetical protein